MRLTAAEQTAIVSSVLKFNEDAEIYLFGSRIDDSKRGRDIDLVIKSDVLKKEMLYLLEDELFKNIDQQKVDFVVTPKSRINSFAAMVLAKGAVILCPVRN